jgi:hypothetical protein
VNADECGFVIILKHVLPLSGIVWHLTIPWNRICSLSFVTLETQFLLVCSNTYYNYPGLYDGVYICLYSRTHPYFTSVYPPPPAPPAPLISSRVCWMIIRDSKTFLIIFILIAVGFVYVLGGVLEDWTSAETLIWLKNIYVDMTHFDLLHCCVWVTIVSNSQCSVNSH